HGIVPVVVPVELATDLGEAAVEDHAVLGEPGALGPLRPELQTDDVVAGAAGSPTPVPGDVRWPPPTADVEHTPRVAGLADRPPPIADHQLSACRSCLLLRREVEQLVAPRDHHVERLVARR